MRGIEEYRGSLASLGSWWSSPASWFRPAPTPVLPTASAPKPVTVAPAVPKGVPVVPPAPPPPPPPPAPPPPPKLAPVQTAFLAFERDMINAQNKGWITRGEYDALYKSGVEEIVRTGRTTVNLDTYRQRFEKQQAEYRAQEEARKIRDQKIVADMMAKQAEQRAKDAAYLAERTAKQQAEMKATTGQRDAEIAEAALWSGSPPVQFVSYSSAFGYNRVWESMSQLQNGQAAMELARQQAVMAKRKAAGLPPLGKPGKPLQGLDALTPSTPIGWLVAGTVIYFLWRSHGR